MLIRGLQNLESLPAREGFFVILFVANKKYVKVFKGFNFVRAKPPLRRAESRFVKPRCSLERERVYSFRLYEKNGEYPRGLRPSGLRGAIQISARYVISAEMTGVHQVTGDTEKRRVPGYRR